MTEIAKSDVFFFITSVSIVVVAVILVSVLIYSFFVIKKIKKLVDKVKEESEEVIDDIHEFRMKLKAEKGFLKRVPAFIVFFRKLFKK